MGVSNFQDLKNHAGHNVVVVIYGDDHNAAIECEDCNEVLLDYDNVEEEEIVRTYSIRENGIGCKEKCPVCGEMHKASMGVAVFDEYSNMPICYECQEEHTPELRKVLNAYFKSVWDKS